MNQESMARGGVIEAVAKALSEWTATRLVEIVPDLPARYGPEWRTEWVGAARQHLDVLIQAVAVDEAAIFVDAVTWARTALAAREVPVSDLRASLSALREVIGAELPADVSAPCLRFIDAAMAALGGESPEPPTFVDPGSARGPMALSYLEALLEGRRSEAFDAILAEARAGLPVRKIYELILQPSLAELGRLWQLQEITTADEHLATAATQTLMSMLRPFFPTTAPNGKTVLATSVGGDLHEVGIRMVSEFFEMSGWTAFYLGANTPAADVITALGAHRADLLAISATTHQSLIGVHRLVDAVRGSKAPPGHTAILVGGAPFNLVPDLWKKVGADGFARNAADAVEVGTALVNGRG